MRKAIKKAISLLLVAVMVFGAAPLAGLVGFELPSFAEVFNTKAEAATSGTCGDNLTWTFDESTGELVISGTGDMYDYSDEVAPWSDNGSAIKSVKISDGVTSIGNSAFAGYENLSSVSIGNGVTTISDYAFCYCPALTNVEIPDGVISIGGGAFAACANLKSITFPDSLISIGDGAFAECTALASITIPENVTNIGAAAFYNCASFTSITVDSANTAYLSDEYGVLFNKNKTELIRYPMKNGLTSYVIPDSVTNIGYYAFQDCTDLTNIVIGNSVTNIGECAFSGCNGITNIIIPDSVTNIDYCAFEYCDNLTSIVIGDNVANIGKGAFYDCNSLTEVYYTGTEDEWNEISVASDNKPLQNVTIHYEHSHTYSSVVIKEPTCTETGTLIFNCECGKTYTELKPALEHDIIIDKAVASTCTATGLTAGQHCSRCDDMTIEQEVVPSKPHNPTEKYDSSKHWKECICGLKTNEENHSFISGNVCSCGYKRVTDATLSINHNTGSKTINYGETLELTAVVINRPANVNIYWYVDDVKSGEGEVFNIKFKNGSKNITVKLVDENGVVYQDANGNEISDSETVYVNDGFFQKIISFFKDLFRINRTVVQFFKGV